METADRRLMWTGRRSSLDLPAASTEILNRRRILRSRGLVPRQGVQTRPSAVP